MGKLTRGFLGGFQGQVGTAYGCFWRMMDLIKAMPRKVKRPPTEAQLPVQLRMSLMTSLLSRLSRIIKIGFKDVAPEGQSAMNAAVSYNLANAVTGISPDYTVDFSKLMFSKGKLEEPNLFEIVADSVAKLKFKWQANVDGSGDFKLTDKAIFVAYNPAKGKFVTLMGAVTRAALQYEMQLPPPFSGDLVECYMSFVSEDGKMVSNSVYSPGVEVL